MSIMIERNVYRIFISYKKNMLIDLKYKCVKYCSLKSGAFEYILNDIILLII